MVAEAKNICSFLGYLFTLSFVVFVGYCCFSLFHWQRKALGLFLLGQRGGGILKIRVVMESTLKEISSNGDSVLDMKDKCGVAGGVEDTYGEDRATEDQPITPWTFSVAR